MKMERLTELEKVILLSILILNKGVRDKDIKEDDIVLKFPMRQRKNVRRYIEKLVKKKLLKKKDGKYRMTEKGYKLAKELLFLGGSFVR